MRIDKATAAKIVPMLNEANAILAQSIDVFGQTATEEERRAYARIMAQAMGTIIWDVLSPIYDQ